MNNLPSSKNSVYPGTGPAASRHDCPLWAADGGMMGKQLRAEVKTSALRATPFMSICALLS
jgi:hypothetical protein